MTNERTRMQSFYDALDPAVKIAWGTDRNGNYHSQYARNAWAAWQEAQRASEPRGESDYAALREHFPWLSPAVGVTAETPQQCGNGLGARVGKKFSFSFPTDEEAERAFRKAAELFGLETSKPATHVFSRPECTFKYCPHPELCRDPQQCLVAEGRERSAEKSSCDHDWQALDITNGAYVCSNCGATK